MKVPTRYDESPRSWHSWGILCTLGRAAHTLGWLPTTYPCPAICKESRQRSLLRQRRQTMKISPPGTPPLCHQCGGGSLSIITNLDRNFYRSISSYPIHCGQPLEVLMPDRMGGTWQAVSFEFMDGIYLISGHVSAISRDHRDFYSFVHSPYFALSLFRVHSIQFSILLDRDLCSDLSPVPIQYSAAAQVRCGL